MEKNVQAVIYKYLPYTKFTTTVLLKSVVHNEEKGKKGDIIKKLTYSSKES